MMRAFFFGWLVLLTGTPTHAQLQLVPQAPQQLVQAAPGPAGIGARLIEQNGTAVISEVIPHSPAATAGLKPQDTIVWVDYRDVTGMKLEEVVNLIRGEVGTSVVITVMHPGETKPHTFTLTRERIMFNF
jgi:carboxyl-terminal processing protease